MVHPLVSVFMLTYNQEQFIAQAIEGVLMQETNFTFQLVIGEDGSTDNTLNICQSYQKKYPAKVKVIHQKQNVGLIRNFMITSNGLVGKYIAICDGDDYWTDPLKLQKQVDVLEENTEYVITYARTERLYPDHHKTIKPIQTHQLQDKQFEDLIFDNCIPSVTALFINPLLKCKLPSWFEYLPYGDWPMYLLVLKDGGKIHFMNDTVAVYRMQIGESFKLYKSMVNTVKVKIKILEYMHADSLFEDKKNIVYTSFLKSKQSLMLAYQRESQYLKALQVYVWLLKKQNTSLNLTKLYVYSIYKKLCSQ